MKAELLGAEKIILQEIADKALHQKDVALTYAYLLRQGHRDFSEIHRAIVERWSRSGLDRVKKMAWNVGAV